MGGKARALPDRANAGSGTCRSSPALALWTTLAAAPVGARQFCSCCLCWQWCLWELASYGPTAATVSGACGFPTPSQTREAPVTCGLDQSNQTSVHIQSAATGLGKPSNAPALGLHFYEVFCLPLHWAIFRP